MEWSKNHKIRKLKKDEYHKITQVIQFDNFIGLGYSDGIVLVYEITKKSKINNNKNNEKLNFKNDENSKEENKEEDYKEDNLYEENEKSNNEEEKNSNTKEDKLESESNINLNDSQNAEIKKDNKSEKEEDPNEVINLDYYNFFRLCINWAFPRN